MLFSWNDAVAVRHPSLWVFLRKLKDEQATHEARRGELVAGRPAPARRQKWVQLEEMIVNLRRRLQAGMPLVDYWRGIRNAVHSFK